MPFMNAYYSEPLHQTHLNNKQFHSASGPCSLHAHMPYLGKLQTGCGMTDQKPRQVDNNPSKALGDDTFKRQSIHNTMLKEF